MRRSPGRAPVDQPSRGVFTRRALLMMGGQAAALGLLGERLYHLQIADGRQYAEQAENNRVSTRLLAPPRGRITDRFGVVLAGNKVNWRALLLPEQTTDISGTLDRFAAIIPLDDHERARIAREVHHARKFVPVVVADFLSWDDMARIQVNAPELPGILIDVGTTRLYPQGESMAHVVGSTFGATRTGTSNVPSVRIGSRS